VIDVHVDVASPAATAATSSQPSISAHDRHLAETHTLWETSGSKRRSRIVHRQVQRQRAQHERAASELLEEEKEAEGERRRRRAASKARTVMPENVPCRVRFMVRDQYACAARAGAARRLHRRLASRPPHSPRPVPAAPPSARRLPPLHVTYSGKQQPAHSWQQPRAGGPPLSLSPALSCVIPRRGLLASPAPWSPPGRAGGSCGEACGDTTWGVWGRVAQAGRAGGSCAEGAGGSCGEGAGGLCLHAPHAPQRVAGPPSLIGCRGRHDAAAARRRRDGRRGVRPALLRRRRPSCRPAGCVVHAAAAAASQRWRCAGRRPVHQTGVGLWMRVGPGAFGSEATEGLRRRTGGLVDWCRWTGAGGLVQVDWCWASRGLWRRLGEALRRGGRQLPDRARDAGRTRMRRMRRCRFEGGLGGL
jgi:hypothetical protein